MTESARILFLINGLGPGGTERQLLYLLQGLPREQLDPLVVTVYDEVAVPAFYRPDLEALSVPLYTLSHGPGLQGRFRALSHYVSLVWRLRPRFVQSFLHYSNLIARAARPLCPPHVLYTSARGVFSRRGLKSEAYTAWLDNGLVVNARHIAEQVLQNTRRSPHRIYHIPNGVQLDRFAANPDPGLRDRLFPGARFVVGMVARIVREKDHMTVLRALCLLPDEVRRHLRVFFVGDTPDNALRWEMMGFVGSHGLEAIVQQLPVTDMISACYHAADVLVLSSIQEGFPNVILEAFAANKPAIVSEAADREGLVQPSFNGWRFTTGDAQALAERILSAYNASSSTRAQLSAGALRTAREYDVKSMVSRYSSLYLQHVKANAR